MAMATTRDYPRSRMPGQLRDARGSQGSPDRKAARPRRGLDGGRAVVNRILGGAPDGLHSLVLRR